jgi:DNA excision repair protein ERCC-6-like
MDGKKKKRKGSQKQLKKSYNDALKVAQTYDLDGDVEEAKNKYEIVLQICKQLGGNTEKIRKKINKLGEAITKRNIENTTKNFGTLENDEEENNEIQYINKKLYENLYPHQKIGVAWLWKLYMRCSGGILADDMGLGKTLQVIAFISALLHQRPKRRILIVAPASLLPHWKSEINRWDSTINVFTFRSKKGKKRNQGLARIIKTGGVVLTNYEKIWHSERSSNIDLFTCASDNACNELNWKVGKILQWATVVLDEGHRIKNHNTGIHDALSTIKSRMRLVLSGTPFQNNLNELWALFTYISDGKMFPSLTTFRKHIGVPIERGEKLDSTAHERRNAKYKRQQLHLKIQDFILRREKGKTIKVNHEENAEKVRKHDVVAWIPMSTVQQDMYRQVLKSSRVQTIIEALENEVKTDGGNILLAMNDLKQVCDGTKIMEDNIKPLDEHSSCKLSFLKSLLQYFQENKHRTLIFSKYTRVLNAIELMCVRHHFKCARIDGSVKHDERQEVVDAFNHDNKFDCMLLTTGVGAVGLTLTGADRVVIFGPDWNPAVDNQAVDRAFRIGQKQDVLCYRLMTCNTIEEKMYRRQVFKEGLVRSVIEDKSMNVYSSGHDLMDVFELQDPDISDMQEYLAIKQQDIRESFEKKHVDLCNELNAIENFNCYGISHHDVLFDEEREEDEADQFVPPPTPQQKERNVEETLLGLENQENKKILVAQNNGKKKKHKKKKKEKKKFAYLFDEEAEEDDEEENNIDNMKSTLEDLEYYIKNAYDNDNDEIHRKILHLADEIGMVQYLR